MITFAASSPTTAPSATNASVLGRHGKTFFRLAAGGLLVGYLVLHTQWAPVAAAIRGLSWGHWLTALVLNLLAQVASGWRWSALARPLGFALSRLSYVRLYFAGMFFSLCLPSSIGGDVLKAYWLAPTIGGRLLAACSVLADRLAGVVALLVIGLTALIGKSYGLSVLGIAGIGLVLFAAALGAASLGLALLARLGSVLPQRGRVKSLIDQLQPYQQRPQVFRYSVGWGLVVQLLNVLVVMQLGWAMNLGLPATAFCLAVPAVSLLTILPVSISGVGVRESALVWMLASYGISAELAVTLGLLWFLVTVVSGMVGGGVYLFGVRSTESNAATAAAESSAMPSPTAEPALNTTELQTI